jgi:hypothetical protein
MHTGRPTRTVGAKKKENVMTRRERIEARLEKRRQWMASRQLQAESAFKAARAIGDNIPFGQPILVGHHSERRHRSDLAKIDSAMRRGCESVAMAERHEQVAETLEANLDRSIYSDDADAIEQLHARIAEREAEAQRRRLVNKAHKAFWKSGAVDVSLSEADQALARQKPRPYPDYSMQNLRARITADKNRIEQIKRQMQRREKAKDAGGIRIVEKDFFSTVTFAEKPERAVIDALKTAGFRWSAGSWHGYKMTVPQVVRDMVNAPAVPVGV